MSALASHVEIAETALAVEHGPPTRISTARARLARVLAEWSEVDVLRLDALCALGPPADVVRVSPADVVVEPGEEKWGTLGLRAATTPEALTRADVLHAWRRVGALCGLPLPSPHAITE